MAVYRRSNRTRSVLLVLVLLAITVVTLDARAGGNHALSSFRNAVRDGFAPVQRATHSALQPVGNFFTGALQYGSLKSENERLRQQLAAAAAANIQTAAEQRQAQQVLANEHLPFVEAIPTVAARVIDRSPSNFETTVTINKGSRDGLAVGQPVVTVGGLVGSIAQAAPHTASVRLVTDPSFVVGVQLDQSNTGAAQGVGAGSPMRVAIVTTKQTPPTEAKGQPVVTSGLNLETFPPDIPVGRVSQVSTPAGTAEPIIDITPLVDLNNLSFVQVELWSPQSRP